MFLQNLMTHQLITNGKKLSINKKKLYELVEVLPPYVSPRGLSPNIKALGVDEKLAVCLHSLKDADSI